MTAVEAPRARILATLIVCVFAVLGARAVQLSFGEPRAPAPIAALRPLEPEPVKRADIVDRNGVLLASTLPSYVLAVEPTPKASAADIRRLVRAVPGLSPEDVARKLAGPGDLVYLKPGLTASQRQDVHDLGIPWVRFDEGRRRAYPNATLAGHALGFVNRDLAGVMGAERAFEDKLTGAETMTLSLDVRIQHAVEAELERVAALAEPKGVAAVVLDGVTGEALAAASWPAFNPNDGGDAPEAARASRLGAVYEMGSTLKPFTVAMGLDAKATYVAERFDVAEPLIVDGVTIRDEHPAGASIGLGEAIAHSSNQVAAQIALRVGARTQRKYLEGLGLLAETPMVGAIADKGFARDDDRPLTVATLGYGYAMLTSPLALAAAYTVFVNDGERVEPTLLRRRAGEAAPRTPVLSPMAAHEVLKLMRTVVTEGTARTADLARFDIAGKTGTAEKPRDGAPGYDPDRVVASFAAVFPASAPRYVIVLAIDEPRRRPENGNHITGGALAAPAVGRIAAGIAPFLGLTPISSAEERRSIALAASGGGEIR